MIKKLKEFKKKLVKGTCSFLGWISMGYICLGHCSKGVCHKKNKKS